MILSRSSEFNAKATQSSITDLLQHASTTKLREYVEAISFPRHFEVEKQANIRARDMLVKFLREFGYEPVLQGDFDNVVATSSAAGAGPSLLLGAHYDSVPGCPGADDNASAVAACLECARIAKQHDIKSVLFVLFNREEDWFLGSEQFVAKLASSPQWQVAEAHILEMVGYRSRAPRSQRMPPGLSGLATPTIGDFLALLANEKSSSIADDLLSLAATHLDDPPVLAVKFNARDKQLRHFFRSDHVPFWQAGIKALMWTDTSSFRNPNYHKDSDTPNTLDYGFLTQVTKLALSYLGSRRQ